MREKHEYENDPLSVPVEWHRYLYRSILLPWEISLKHEKDFPRYARNRPLSGVTLNKLAVNQSITDVLQSQLTQGKTQSSLTFVSRGAALHSLFGLLRNCVAHGHYASASTGRISFYHVYDGKLKLFGSLRFRELKGLISFLCTPKS